MKKIPTYSGTLRSHLLAVPHCISECSGIRIFGRRIKSLVFTTDVAIIKNVSVLTQKGNDTLSAEELSFYLDITPRSALRILSKLEAGGYASVQFRRQLNLRGRPAKIYQIHIQDLT